MPDISGIRLIGINNPIPLKVGDVLYRASPDSKVDEQMVFEIDIAFAEPNIAEDSIVATLSQARDNIARLIASFVPLLS